MYKSVKCCIFVNYIWLRFLNEEIIKGKDVSKVPR